MVIESPGLDVLNIGSGHLKFRFDREDAGEVEKAKKVLTDMLRRGYMLFVMVDGEQKRVRAFDAKHEEYILEEPDVIPEPEPLVAAVANMGGAREVIRGRKGRRVSMRSTRATGIGPSAGG